MIYIFYVFHLSILNLILLIIGIFSQTTIQLLLVLVGIVFIQGLVLIGLGVSMIGTYIMIIYIGAIVILFAFCILFINSKEITEKEKNPIKNLSYLIILLATWEIVTSLVSSNPSNKSLGYLFSSNSEVNYMLDLGKSVFTELLIPLLMMLGILLLGLLVTIKIIKNKC